MLNLFQARNRLNVAKILRLHWLKTGIFIKKRFCRGLFLVLNKTFTVIQLIYVSTTESEGDEAKKWPIHLITKSLLQ